MKMLKAMLLLFLSSTAAQAAPFDQFTDSKTGYVVDVENAGSKIMLNGRHPVTGATFQLEVTPQGNVTGLWEGKPVNYMLSARAQRARRLAY